MTLVAGMTVFSVLEVVGAVVIAVYCILDWPVIRGVDEQAGEWPAPAGGWAQDGALVWVAPDGEEVELPVAPGWDTDAILATFAQIEAL
jgi:hypothetical protein